MLCTPVVIQFPKYWAGLQVFGAATPFSLQSLAAAGTAGKHGSNIQRDVFRKFKTHATNLDSIFQIL